MTMVKTSTYDVLCEALTTLAGRCNGAITRDDVGFNGSDTGLGRSLADYICRGGQMTEGQQLAAIKMIQKYRNQLLGCGVDIPSINDYTVKPLPKLGPAPVGSTPASKPVTQPDQTIDAMHGELVVSFKYDPTLVTKIKTLPLAMRKFDPGSKTWHVNPSLHKLVVAIMPNAFVTTSAQGLIAKQGNTPSPVIAPPAPFTISLESGQLILRFEYDPQLVERVKALPERKFDPGSKHWIVPGRLAVEVINAFPDAKMSVAVMDLAESQAKLASKANAQDSTFDVKLATGSLMPFQRAGVEFLDQVKGNAILGDDMGLGKTIQLIALCELHPEWRPAIIVTPASVKLNWAKEIDKFMTTRKQVHVITGKTTYDLPNADIYLINYDILGAWVEPLKALNAKLLGLDEAHRIKDPKSKRSQAAGELGTGIPHRVLLTGTPVLNRPKELWPLLNFIAPDDWPNFFQFGKRYCGAKQIPIGRGRMAWDFSGASNLQELYTKVKPYMIRRKKEQVLPDLPERRSVRIEVALTDKQRKEYDAAIEEAQEEIEEKGNGAEALAMIEKAKQITLAAKLPAILEWMEDFLETDQKLVMFAAHRDATEQLYEAFKPQAVKIVGGLSDEQRQSAKEKFQGDDSIRLFVGNHQAAGEGITLTAASNLGFTEYPWTPGLYRQCRDRIYRIGQKNACTIYNFICPDTIDESIINLLERKAGIIDTAIDGQGNADIGGSIVDDLIKIISNK